jgi:hypothetical protein
MPYSRPGFDIRTLAAKRRNKNNPWFKHGTLLTSAIDVLRRRAQAPMTAREIADVLLADKSPKATRMQAIGVQGYIFHAMRKRDGTMVVGVGAPAQWRLKEPAN